MNKGDGYLEIILGPMFSGKTSKLIDIHKMYTFCGNQVIVVNHSFDNNRYGVDMSTHDGNKISCTNVQNLKEIFNIHNNIFKKKNGSSTSTIAVLINEAQFFTDLYDVVHDLISINKCHVYVAGLDGDSDRNKFGQIIDLIPLCDKVNKLKSLCYYCKNGTHAIFSFRVDECKDQINIGSSDKYIPLCRKCYENKLKT